MEGKIENGAVRLAGGELCPAPLPADCGEGTEVQLSVRPEKIRLDASGDGLVVLKGKVVERVYVGTSTQVIVELAAGARLVALEQNTHVSDAGDRWEIGHEVSVAWLPEHSRVLR